MDTGHSVRGLSRLEGDLQELLLLLGTEETPVLRSVTNPSPIKKKKKEISGLKKKK
jgi:hypothetical protein